MNTKTDISAAYVGSTGVDKLCLGNEVVWQNTPPGPVPYEQQYLTIHALDQASLQSNTAYTGGSVYYRTKGSGNWQTLSPGQTLTISPQAPIQLMGNGGANRLFQEGLQSGHYEVYGNIMSLVHGENFIGQTVIPSNLVDAFAYMFAECSGLVSIKNLVMPATTLSEGCYRSMFNRCHYLTELPDVFVPSAATLSNRCCRYAFEELGASGSTDIDVPSGFIMSTNIASACYQGMFCRAGKISSAPELPATTLADNCYENMFSGCTGLTTAPELPATTLANSCYIRMFWGCRSLTTSPVLPATTLVSDCYREMFYSCRSLNTITCLATNPGATINLGSWTSGVASTGTFYKDASATGWTRGVNGIPTNWTVQNYVDPNAPVLRISGQSITGTSTSGYYEWGNLGQYSGTSFTIEVLGVPITADTWDYSENYIDECGESSEISHDTGTTKSVFEVNSGYIGYVYYDPNNNSVSYVSDDDNTSDDPETICRCQGGCWDGETCQGCEPADPCDDWEGAGYGSYEECTCAERGENCPEEESGE